MLILRKIINKIKDCIGKSPKQPLNTKIKKNVNNVKPHKIF